MWLRKTHSAPVIADYAWLLGPPLPQCLLSSTEHSGHPGHTGHQQCGHRHQTSGQDGRAAADNSVDLAPVIVMDATLSSGTTKCCPQTITGWTENIDYWYKATGGVQTTSQFTPSTGIFIAPILGYYKICSSARFQKGGNSVDMTILKDGSVIAAYGNALQTDWRSTGVCTIQLLTTTNQISLKLQSGGSSDCVQVSSLLSLYHSNYL